jgi:hypothetical protein
MQPGSLLSRLSGSAELTDTYRRGGIPAPLALQRNVPEQCIAVQCIAVRAPPPYQQRPRDIGNASTTRAGRPEMRLALSLGLGNGSGSPVGNDFHRRSWAGKGPSIIPFPRCQGGTAPRGDGPTLIVAAGVRLRPYHCKHRRGACQSRRILHSEYLRRDFCRCRDMQGTRSFFGRDI